MVSVFSGGKTKAGAVVRARADVLDPRAALDPRGRPLDASQTKRKHFCKVNLFTLFVSLLTCTSPSRRPRRRSSRAGL